MSKNSIRHIERASFLIGEPDSGKSDQLRSMFRDWRLGNRGNIPKPGNLANTYPLSSERWLYLRMTSPHERGETLKTFLGKCEKEMQRYKERSWRWNLACPLQPNAENEMPDSVTTISKFITHFDPERVRAVLFHPDWQGNTMEQEALFSLMNKIQALPRTEVILTDARSREGNGLIYADFFDFT